MRNFTRKAFNQLAAQIASINSVDLTDSTFEVDPSVQQTLETRMQESSAFLQRINIAGVTESEGQKLGLGIGGPIASRTDTTQNDRVPRDVTTQDAFNYKCVKTDSDTFIPYAKLDAWAKFPDFQARVRDLIIKRQALDRIVIGFNGTSVATATDLANNPLLQDVNKGWLQNLRDASPERVMAEVVAASGKVNVGSGGDYENMDALVFDMVSSLIDPWYRDGTDLVAIVGRSLMHDKLFPLVNKDQPSTEVLASDIIISQKRLGGLPAATVPYFPDGKILITSYDNLSVYWQEGARRRMLQDNPRRDRVENFESSNDAYVLEDHGKAALAENITLV